MARLSGPVVYGVARGTQDAETSGQQAEAFEADQAIRRERLDTEKELRPIRRDAMKLQLQEAGLNLDVTKMRKDELAKLSKDMDKARTDRKAVGTALSEFQASGNPGPIAEALGQINERFAGMTASREEDGTITLTAPDGTPKRFQAGKFPDGTEMSPDDSLGIFVSKYLDPIKWIEKEYSERFGIAKEQEKQGALTRRAVLGNQSRERVATTRAGEGTNRRSEAWFTKEHGAIKTALDSVLKTQGVAGSFIAGYAHENDAALRAVMEERMSEEVEGGTRARAAVRNVVDDVRKTYDAANKIAGGFAKELAKAGISARDPEAVAKAAKAGNANAKELMKIMKITEEELGYGVAKYLQSTLSGK